VELFRQVTVDEEAERSMAQNPSPGSRCLSVSSVPSCPPQAGARNGAGGLISNQLTIFERRAPVPWARLLA